MALKGLPRYRPATETEAGNVVRHHLRSTRSTPLSETGLTRGDRKTLKRSKIEEVDVTPKTAPSGAGAIAYVGRLL